MEDRKQIHRILEGAIFAAGEPLSIDRILLLFDEKQRPEKKQLREALKELAEDYADRGIELLELASGYQFQVKADLSQWVKKLWEEKPPRYSRALMETLALVAYRQPITRAEIEEVRGVVVSSNIVRTLMEHGWIRVVGHRDVPGKPALLATTKQFLDNFGLKSLNDLPPLSEIESLDQMEKGLEEALVDSSIDATVDSAEQSEDNAETVEEEMPAEAFIEDESDELDVEEGVEEDQGTVIVDDYDER